VRAALPWLLPAAYAAVRLSAEYAGAPEWEVAVIDVAFLIGFLYTLSDDVEKAVAELGIHGLYNVLVVSWVAAIPQTVVALYFAQAGRHAAAFYDSMVSTLVDAFIVTALVRLRYLDAVRRDWPLIALWVAATLAFGATVDAPERLAVPAQPYYWAWFLVGALGLPALFARGLPAEVRLRPGTAVNLAVNTVLVCYVSWDLGRALAAWHASEAQLGAVAAVIATLPDLITALLIRATLGRMIAEFAAAEDAIRTMFAAAVHDQISVPALVMIAAPAAAAAFPHWLNVYVSLLKFTLLDRRAFLLCGLPAAAATVIYLAAPGGP
jgi:hypothetical protein